MQTALCALRPEQATRKQQVDEAPNSNVHHHAQAAGAVVQLKIVSMFLPCTGPLPIKLLVLASCGQGTHAERIVVQVVLSPYRMIEVRHG